MAPTTRARKRLLNPATPPPPSRYASLRPPTSAPLPSRNRNNRVVKRRALARPRKGCWTPFPAISNVPRVFRPTFLPAPAEWARFPGVGLTESRIVRRRDAGDGEEMPDSAVAAVKTAGNTVNVLRARVEELSAENNALKHHWAINLEKMDPREDTLADVDFSDVVVPEASRMDEDRRIAMAGESVRYRKAAEQVFGLMEERKAMRVEADGRKEQARALNAKVKKLVNRLEQIAEVEGDGDKEVQAQWNRELGAGWWAYM
ncbi:MAG: hypothetical protein Q9202_005287 [Teloschistes flavicans]